MKYIEAKKLYDTDTATAIASWSEGYFSEFEFFTETLYQKKNGEFFLYGKGGADSAYGRECGFHSRCGSEQISPLTLERASEWAEKHADADTYMKYFGEIEE